MMQDFKRIVVINCDGIGDVILSMPLLKALRELYPHSKIALLIDPMAAQIAKAYPFYDQLILYKKGKGFFRTLKQIFRYDLSICLDGRHRSAMLPFLAGVKVRVGNVDGISMALGKHDGIYSLKRDCLVNHKAYVTPAIYQTYQVQNLANIVEQGLKIKLNLDCSRLCPPQLDQIALQEAREILPDDGNSYWAIAPFSSGSWKDWPLDKYRQLMQRMSASDAKIRFIMLGSPQNAAIDFSYPDMIDLRGKTSLYQTFAILQDVDYFIGSCSAPLHMAAAVGKPCVAIYGATSSDQYAPKHHTIIVQAPAGDVETRIKQITVEQVYDACQKITKER